MERAGSRQSSPTPKAQPRSHLRTLRLLGTSPVCPSPASDPDWPLPEGCLRGFFLAQSSDLRRSGGQCFSSHVWLQLYKNRLDDTTAQVPLPDRGAKLRRASPHRRAQKDSVNRDIRQKTWEGRR